MIKLIPKYDNPSRDYDVFFKYPTLNTSESFGVHLGTFELDIDGYYYFWNKSENNGSWSSYSLRLIADKLDEINAPWKDKINEEFNQSNNKSLNT